MRLDKYLSHAQIGTRKAVKQWIRKGHISVNGSICIKDDIHIDEEHDIICLDDEVIQYQSICYIMMNKPQGVISATKDASTKTVMDLIEVPIPSDCFLVGRLDCDTEGLLLICNDGKLAHQLTTPKNHVEKEYYLEIDHPLKEQDITLLESGTILLDGTCIQPAKVKQISDASLYLTIHEGKYHQVKRMLQAVHNEVCYLKRIRMKNLCLDDTLAAGEWRYLQEAEIEALRK